MERFGIDLDALIHEEEVNKSDYRYIDTIRYESEIEQICHGMSEKMGVDCVSCCLILPNKSRYILSSNPGRIVIPYHLSQLNKIDNLFDATRYRSRRPGCFLPEEIPNDSFGKLFNDILSQKYGVYNVLGFTRRYQGYELIVIFGRYQNRSAVVLNEQLRQKAYQFVDYFFENMLPIYVRDKMGLKYSRIVQDNYFRHRFLLTDLNENLPDLKERELQCLYWARMGKSAEETAMILSLSKATVRRYLETVREKCDVNTIQEAIALALQQQWIA